jgi:hypothetical protein
MLLAAATFCAVLIAGDMLPTTPPEVVLSMVSCCVA